MNPRNRQGAKPGGSGIGSESTAAYMLADRINDRISGECVMPNDLGFGAFWPEIWKNSRRQI
jgi:hypothetical protein